MHYAMDDGLYKKEIKARQKAYIYHLEHDQIQTIGR